MTPLTAPCIFCGSVAEAASEEHVIPKWARRAFHIQGPVTVRASDWPDPERKDVDRLQHLNVTLTDALCENCNSKWLGPIEGRVARVLRPMMVNAAPAVLDTRDQGLLAFWAVKTILLLELSVRQMFPGARAIEGYAATAPELAWLRAREEPPPRSMVWLGCWDCKRENPLMYEPSAAPLPAADGRPLSGHLATFALGFAVFQVFTVNFVAAEQAGARVWNPNPPAPIRAALPRIWPPLARTPNIRWPTPAFPRDDWHRIVTWNGALRLRSPA